MTQPFKPSPTDIQNLQTIRRAINRTVYQDDHGEIEDDDALKVSQYGKPMKGLIDD